MVIRAKIINIINKKSPFFPPSLAMKFDIIIMFFYRTIIWPKLLQVDHDINL